MYFRRRIAWVLFVCLASESIALAQNPTTPVESQARLGFAEITEGEGKNAETKKNDEAKKDDEPKKDEGPMRLIQGDLCGWKIYGFVNATGIVNTTNGGGNRYNGPWNISDQTGAYLSQTYLTLEKTMGDKIALGGRADVLFGNDYLGLQSRGWELNRNEVITPASERLNTGADYGIANPQLYAELGTSKASVVVGHFYTPLGYEVAPANANFFNTHSYAFLFSPYTHWGVQGKWNPDEHWAFTAAVVNGWDSLDREQNSPAASSAAF